MTDEPVAEKRTVSDAQLNSWFEHLTVLMTYTVSIIEKDTGTVMTPFNAVLLMTKLHAERSQQVYDAIRLGADVAERMLGEGGTE